MKAVVEGLPEEQYGLTVLVVDTFTLTLLDATVGLAAVVDAGFLGWRLLRTRVLSLHADTLSFIFVMSIACYLSFS